MSQDQESNGIPVDNPIRKREQDLLGRTSAALSFVEHVLALDASQGIVVGVFGPWGSGKTSFLNLARQEFDQKDVAVITFNPWFFSGTEQLINRFFAELADPLQLPGGKHDEVGKVLSVISEYGTCLQGKAGALSKFGRVYYERRRGSLAQQREKAKSALEKLGKPIVVLLDDVDRLSAVEIWEIFRLVRLTGSFPNLVYVVACDRVRIEEALSKEGSGRDYLEKIVQLSFNVPESPMETLRSELSTAISMALSDNGCVEKIDGWFWADVFPEIILPLIRNLRDVRRYAASARESIASLHDQVALSDVLALEAVRLFLPDVFKRLRYMASSLTVAPPARSPHSSLVSDAARLLGEDHSHREEIEKLVELGGEGGKQVVGALLKRLFPGTKHSDAERNVHLDEPNLLAQRRVAHESVLRLYLERVVDSDLRVFLDAKGAFERMSDLKAFSEFMDSIDPLRLEALIGRIVGFGGQFRPDHVEAGTTGILNLWTALPRKANDYDALRLFTVVVRLILQTLDSPQAIAAMVRQVLRQLNSLSARWILVRAVAFEPKSNANFVSKDDSDSLQTAVGNAIRSASFGVDKLIEERNPAKLLRFARKTESEEPLSISDSPKLTYVILRDSITVSGSSTLQSSASSVSYGLDWPGLTEIYGTSETVNASIESLHERFEELIPWFESRAISRDEARLLIDMARQGEEPNSE